MTAPIASDQTRDDLAANFASIQALLADPQAKPRDANKARVRARSRALSEAAALAALVFIGMIIAGFAT